MNAIEMARSFYGNALLGLRDTRSTEQAIFSRITAALIAAEGANFPTKVKALHDNRRLWTWLAADVASAQNQLPADLRARLFYLAEFTLDHSSKVLREGADLAPLIDINRAMLLGLAPRQKEPA
ncbi:flagellar biosynthesis regulator FlaF [Ketogulonicigenium vulgare]|uniref:Flagellar FlaF family protein n=1 Tax=Ketogulonicigenium vulgare (strain WSH-001) TaxID=759362 RepID=F9Y4F2_KETVW|nr:flagellar biosynthesis regulator FlaF [Ketogulonicigenium vulgare]ADO43486.1 flagellar biosynthesis regulatory protein FlaF [Ketogulonicigenium vulgare Y25]AEM41765.1 Flagellar FlaF family protein [Ketogulonicigenium vulgare WSH-001]ALJ81871.1 flagellar biosynthesis regulator FlhF [Ketogulonicigenium vulgare]ANW34522.1 flagellar biosynthesis regulator FlhF [Ketogulonicigenium vulgare]AOZ55521.1 flagellar biosynthesis regulatory protein FlaF [Ketogulonicigenium vulgare]